MLSQTGFSVAILLETKQKPLPKTVFKLTVCFLCTLDNMKKRSQAAMWLTDKHHFGQFWFFLPRQLPETCTTRFKRCFWAKFPTANGLNKIYLTHTFVIYLLNSIFVFCSSEPTKKGFSLLSVLKRQQWMLNIFMLFTLDY